MTYSVFGHVVGVRKFSNGDIEIDFYNDDEIIEYTYSTESNSKDLPKELAETLANTLATDICAEIFFNEDGVVTHIELEECDYDDDEFDEEI